MENVCLNFTSNLKRFFNEWSHKSVCTLTISKNKSYGLSAQYSDFQVVGSLKLNDFAYEVRG